MLLSATVCLLAAILGVCTEPVVRPKFRQIKYSSSSKVQCDFGTPIIDCKIRVASHSGHCFDEVLDFAAGAQSKRVVVPFVEFSYAGTGLANGKCGVEIAAMGNFIALVECFGQAADRQWSRGFGLLVSQHQDVLPVTVPTRRLIAARPGSDVTVLLEARGALQYCGIRISATEHVFLSPTSPLPSSDSRFRLHGAGKEHGECGFTLPNVQPSDGGLWKWWGFQKRSLAEQTTVVLVLAAPVGEPTLEVLEPATLRAGSQLSATCRAPPSVPPANITWLLGGEVVRRDDFNMTSLGDVAKAHVWHAQSVVQTLTRVLKEDDSGKRLECRIDHPALAASKTVALQLPVTTPATTPTSTPTTTPTTT